MSRSERPGRWLALLLALALFCSLAPSAALAADSSEYICGSAEAVSAAPCACGCHTLSLGSVPDAAPGAAATPAGGPAASDETEEDVHGSLSGWLDREVDPRFQYLSKLISIVVGIAVLCGKRKRRK